MDIVLQAVINALEERLKGLDPNSPEAQDVQAQLQTFYAAGTSADTAKKNKASDEKINPINIFRKFYSILMKCMNSIFINILILFVFYI